MAENLTAAELRERLSLERTEFDRLQRAKVWPRVATKQGDRYPWPKALSAYIAERERVARDALPATISQQQLAEIINRTTKTVYNYQSAGLPHEQAGKAMRYPTIVAIRWCIAHFLAEKSGESGTGKAPSLSAQQAMEDLLRARAQRQREEIRLATDQGRSIIVDDALRWYEDLGAVFMSALQNLPSDISDDLVGLTTKAKARAAVRNAVEPTVAAVRERIVQVADRIAQTRSAEPSATDGGVDDNDDEVDE